MREFVLDTETTGLDPAQGHRLVELGCIELLNRIPTGSTFHVYLNPERDVPAEAAAIHGLTSEFLKDKPRFIEIVDDFLAFIGDEAPLVIHNAGFDHGFLCAELKRAERALIARERLIDTLMLARRKHSAGPYSLDALCLRYGIDNSRRTKHGALLDAEILAEVYVELTGARQAMLGLAEGIELRSRGAGTISLKTRPIALAPRVSEAERQAHRAFVASLGEEALWRNYLPNHAKVLPPPAPPALAEQAVIADPA
jgi:DNA polymerase-3 subunit epsilon